MKKYIIGIIVVLLADIGIFMYVHQENESDQAKEYPNIRLYLEDLLTDNEYGVHIDDKNGQEITEEFLNDYQEIYDKEGLDTVMDGYIDEFAENGYSLRVDHPKKFTKS